MITVALIHVETEAYVFVTRPTVTNVTATMASWDVTAKVRKQKKFLESLNKILANFLYEAVGTLSKIRRKKYCSSSFAQ